MLVPNAATCAFPNQAVGFAAIASRKYSPLGSLESPVIASPNRVVHEPIHSSGRIGPPGPLRNFPIR